MSAWSKARRFAMPVSGSRIVRLAQLRVGHLELDAHGVQLAVLRFQGLQVDHAVLAPVPQPPAEHSRPARRTRPGRQEV